MKLRKPTEFKSFAGTGTLTEVAAYDTRSNDIISLSVRNRGPGAVSAFEIRVKPTAGYQDPPITVKTSNYTTPDEYVVSCNLDPTTLASGAVSLVDIDCSYRAYVHIFANVPVGTTLEVVGGLYDYDGR